MKEQKKTTIRNLTWKLVDMPTAKEVADLVNAGVITTDEGREIIFGSPESDKDKIKTLEQQVAILTELVKNQSNTTTYVPVPYVKEFTVPYRPWDNRIWMSTAKALGGSGYTMTSNANGGTVTYSLASAGSNGNLLTLS